MPRYLKTPEEWLRDKPDQNLYMIRFTGSWKGFKFEPNPPGKAELMGWFAAHQPYVELTELAHSEFSGFLMSGESGDIAIGWSSEEEVNIYSAAFENPDGQSLRPEWQCYLYDQTAYAQMLERHGDPRELPV